tara:strand:+ start:110 stop:1321 length:1212 start_codon:yes stop_codon:yes gene_type:complete
MEENKEQVVEETTQKTVQKEEQVKFKSANDDNVIKVDLTKPPTPKKEENETKDEIKENNADDSGVVAESENAEPTQEQEKVQPEAETQEPTTLEEITEESTDEEVAEVEEQVEEAIIQAEATGKPLPENIQKLVDFMEETGGDINDYVKLNQDYSKLNDSDVLYEYYKQTKPHLTNEEINFLMEDSFSYDEEEHEEIEIKRKKLALKEQVASARSHLDGQKSKYYKEIKAGSKLTPEQQKAVDFFNRYNKESEETKKASEKSKNIFKSKTEKLFNNKFKGFEYNVGEKNYRFNVKNAEKVKESQSDLNNFVGKFLDKNNEMSDAKGFHKAIFTANNADAIAKHFYEQGKADAMKDSVAKAKNVDMNPRQAHGEIKNSGLKFRMLNDASSSGYEFKIKNNKFKK